MIRFFSGLALIFVSLSVQASVDKCEQYKQDIGTKIQVNLTLDGNKKDPRRFEVTTCKNGIFTAYDKTQNTTLQYAAGQGEIRQVRFVGAAETKNAFNSVVSGTWNLKTGQVVFLNEAESPCPAGQHHDPSMGGMCMPDEPQQCPQGQHWDNSMNMCMPDENSSNVMTMFHYNQFLVLTGATGARGRTAATAPNMWMLMFDKKISDHNTVELSWMGTTDLWTVPKNGTPELFQTGEANAAGVPFIDAQHPHSSPIMGLTFSDILSYGANGEHKLTFFFAPRGEATAGPQAFMHRDSAEGNPDAPLSHHLQDVFHIASTVVGIKADYGKWTVEASTFSGVEPSPTKLDLDVHNPDSYAFRANYRVNDKVNVGGSYARVKALDHENNPLNQTETENAYSSWVQTRSALKDGTLSTATIWGQNDNRTTDVRLDSFLEEFMYELGKNNFYGRLEVLQRTPEQLEVQVTDGRTGAKWIKALTLGFERQIQQRGEMKMYAGAALTSYAMPKEFNAVYGRHPIAAKVYLRIKFNDGMPMEH